MTSVPDRTPFQIRHAQPVAGPGVDPDSAGAESAPAARRQDASTREVPKQREVTQVPSVESQPAISSPPDRRHTLVDLKTVMHMLDMVKASERDHLKSVLHIFDLLGPTGRVRVLHVLNRLFK